jgi:hypothetical protein
MSKGRTANPRIPTKRRLKDGGLLAGNFHYYLTEDWEVKLQKNKLIESITNDGKPCLTQCSIHHRALQRRMVRLSLVAEFQQFYSYDGMGSHQQYFYRFG